MANNHEIQTQSLDVINNESSPGNYFEGLGEDASIPTENYEEKFQNLMNKTLSEIKDKMLADKEDIINMWKNRISIITLNETNSDHNSVVDC
jgi:hypothetical protein